MTTEDTDDNSIDTQRIDSVKLNLNNRFNHMNSKSPQQGKENSPQKVGWKERIKTFCDQERQKQPTKTETMIVMQTREQLHTMERRNNEE